MASTSYGSNAQADSVRAAVAEVKTLTVERLKKVLRAESLLVSGVKGELQTRLIAYIERCAAAGDLGVVDRMRIASKRTSGFTSTHASNPYPSPYSIHTPASSQSPQYNSPTPHNTGHITSYHTMTPFTPNRLVFKHSPFYIVIRPISVVQELKSREHTRDTARIDLRLDPATVEQLQRDPNTRIMVFCAAENLGGRSEPCDISFPQHGELKCNSDDVKHNLKGIKGKAGTTRPVDITQFIRRTPTYPNKVELVYALTTKKYFLVINLVQRRPTNILVSEIKVRRTPFSKDRVIREMRSKASDSDIVTTSTNMSLKDPLQMTRIQTPCRGLSCTHNGCFDAAVYLALQEQAPTWTCPLCHKPVAWDNIAFDQYFDDILQRVSDDIEQVTVDPDGSWHQGQPTASESSKGSQRPGAGDGFDDDDDDDDVVEISDGQTTTARDSSQQTQSNSTPAPTSAPATATPGSSRPSKRSHAETIDLTLDDSDDEPPFIRVKRPSMSSQQSFDTFRNRLPPPPASEPYRFHMPPPGEPSSSSNQRHFPGY